MAETAKDRIVAKALRCIDEVYPSENTINESYLPTDVFIDEVVRWVIDIVPSKELTITAPYNLPFNSNVDSEGVGSAEVSNIGRIVYFKAGDWKRPVFGVITENDPRYIQQSNKVLRGNPSRPIVALVNGRTKLEWYTSESTTREVKHVPYSVDSIPSNLEDLAAWKLAEIVLMSMSDVQSASVCTSKVNEHLQMLAL